MWVETVHLENIKCFEKTAIRLGTKKTPYPWVTLLGENGSGKSTILQALALLLAGPEGAALLYQRPEGWLRQESYPGKISARFHQDDADFGQFGGEKKERKVFQYTLYVTGSQKLTINNKVFTEPVITEDTNSRVLPWLREHAFLSKGNVGWFGVGYGAFRRLTREGSRILVPSLQEPLRHTNFITQFDENRPLEAFEQWLVFLDYRISKDADTQAQRHFDLAVNAFNSLLPDGNRFDSIDSNGRIWFRSGNVNVPTTTISDGFRSVLGLAGDLIWRIITAFPDSDAPLKESGVVLIDELDIHLHPSWQRNIANVLRSSFPALQFIMATHSPIVAAGAGKDAVTYRCFLRDGMISVEHIENVHSYNVDRILQSPAFGLVSAYSEEAQNDIDRYYALKRKRRRSAGEEQELQLVIPTVERALGYGASEADERLDRYIKEHLT